MAKLSRGAAVLRRLMPGLAAIGALALSFQPASAAPERPSDDALVLAIVSPARSSAQDLRDAIADLARRPKDLRLAVAVARLAIEEGRASADPRR